jgi:predicted hotdog family 3-hydroxylacyl-ACP dehydratase
MTYSRKEIESRLPHAGPMCLLDEVVDWDGDRITCIAVAGAAGHPLAREGGIPAIAAAEYAAQATAMHGALLENTDTPRPGMLAMLKKVSLPEAWLPCDGTRITVNATLIGRSDAGCLYGFTVKAAERLVSDGQLMIAFPDQPPR